MKSLVDGMKLKSYLLLIAIAILAFHPSILISQEEEIIDEYAEVQKDELTISELADMLNSSEKEIIISDYIIVNKNTDSDYLIDKIFFQFMRYQPVIANLKRYISITAILISIAKLLLA